MGDRKQPRPRPTNQRKPDPPPAPPKHMAGKSLVSIHFAQAPGQCRWCRCTYDNPCAGGCAWANREQTLCTACEDFDRAVRTIAGRQTVAEFLQEHGFELLQLGIAKVRR